MKKKKHQGSLQRILILIPMVLVGYILAYSIPGSMGIVLSFINSPILLFLLIYAVFLLIFFPTCILQIIIHECGHMIFGWLTGYKLVSFRIGKWILIKQENRWKWKKFSLPGTGGQCLMDPPDFKNGTIPYALYNMGGCILNILVSLLFLIPYLFIQDGTILKNIVLAIILLGFSVAWGNGLPMHSKYIVNDGGNTIALSKNPHALKAFWVVLKTNVYAAKEVRIKDLPEEWFPIPPKEYLQNSIIVNHAVNIYGRLIDQGNIKEAMAYSDQLLNEETALVGIHKYMLICDKIFFELVTENRKEVIDKWMDKQQKRFLKKMKSYPSIIRLNYAYALLYEKDQKAAAQYKAYFDKVASTYPYQAEIEGERELMAAIESHVLYE